MLLEAAIGDAYGAGFEFVDREMIQTAHRMQCYRDHPKWAGTAGKYTDDTQMSVTMVLGSVSSDMVHNLPAFLYDDLEDGPFGQHYLRQLDAALLGAFPRPERI